MKNYSKLLNSIQNDNTSIKEVNINDKVLIVDMMNLFIRSLSVIDKFNNSGNHIGGLLGSLRSLGALIKEIEPTRVILCFDGEGNITNKKNIYAEYKGTRKLKRITNWTGFDSLEQESESIRNQILRLIDYLKCLPVNISVIDKLEADDIIAYLAKKFKKSIIVSADQDFLQLISDQITVYSPIKKKYYTPDVVFQEFGLYPQNFLMKKIILGDTSDNVPKVPKIGPGKLMKMFPELSLKDPITLNKIIEISLEKHIENPWYGDIYNFRKQLYINEQLMDLSEPNIPFQEKERLDDLVKTQPYIYNKTRFTNLWKEDNLENGIQNVDMWLKNNFEKLNIISQNETLSK